MRLMHLANHRSTNIGNAALVLGTERVLREDLEEEPVFVREPWDHYSRGLLRFDEDFVERVNGCDALLVGAAVTFDGRFRFAETGMRFDLPLHLWDRIEGPIVFYGLSNRAWARKPYHHVERLREAVEYAVGSERILFSVRNDGTKEWLESLLGLRSDRILVVPDPAVYVPVEDSWHPELDGAAVNLVLSLNREDDLYRWGGGPEDEATWTRRAERAGTFVRGTRLDRLAYRPAWQRARERFLDDLAGALVRLAGEVDLNLVLCPHTVGDHAMTVELLRRLPDSIHERAPFASTGLATERGPYFYDLYAKADAAISMRIHSMNPSVGLGTPLVPLVSQDRMTAFMADAGLGDLCLNVHDPALDERVLEAVRTALQDPGPLRERLAAAKAALRARTAEFNSKVAAFLASTRRAAGPAV
jgi:hypothetical protein